MTDSTPVHEGVPVRFAKWHALGNAYLVVERAEAGTLDEDRVRRLCDADRGIGADGVLEIVQHRDADGEIVIWNPDGSVAEMSGNGVRIAAAWLARGSGTREAAVTTAGRRVHARLLGEDEVEIDVGRVEVGDTEVLDVAGESVELTRASVGNPHAVVRRDGASREDLLRLGPALESHPAFPARTNVQLVEPVGPNELRVLVWERGAGETASSGSSATAASAVAVARGWCVSPVTVHLPGGELVVTLAGDGASLLGPVAEICRGSVWLGTPATAGTTVGAIGWTDITVEDADQLRDFCAAVLGWSYEGVEMGGYADWAMLAADGTPVAGVCSARGVNAGLPATWLPYVEVADLEASLARCRERGGTVVHERGEAGGERMAVIRDPSGAALALTQRAAR